MAIIIALGANLDYQNQNPLQNIKAAINCLKHNGFSVLAQSSWWRSKPWPPSQQPSYINGIITIHSFLTPETLLFQLHKIESLYGRPKKRLKDEARTLDLDLIDYHGLVYRPKNKFALTLPHPRMQERDFVLSPLCETMPCWNHPVLHQSAESLYRKLRHKDPSLERIF